MILPNKQSNKSAHRTTTQSHGKMMCDAGKELNIWHTATATSTEYEREREKDSAIPLLSRMKIKLNENRIKWWKHGRIIEWMDHSPEY